MLHVDAHVGVIHADRVLHCPPCDLPRIGVQCHGLLHRNSMGSERAKLEYLMLCDLQFSLKSKHEESHLGLGKMPAVNSIGGNAEAWQHCTG